jgi:hypothetical protein
MQKAEETVYGYSFKHPHVRGRQFMFDRVNLIIWNVDDELHASSMLRTKRMEAEAKRDRRRTRRQSC